MEGGRGSDLYFSLWDEFLTATLLPEFHRRYFAPDDQAEVQLTPKLRQHRFDANLYPFIFDRVREFMESVCENYFSRADSDMNKQASITTVTMIFDICTTIDAHAISKTLAPLKNAFLEITSSPIGWTMPIMSMVTQAFRKSVYYKLANILREEAFTAISDDLNVQDPLSLTSYFRLIRKIGEDDLIFFIEEWDKPLYARISKQLTELISKWDSRTLAELLENTKTLIRNCRTIFLFFERGIEGVVMNEIGNVRDLFLFNKDAKQVEQMILDSRNSETMRGLFNLFHEDKEFLKTMAYHASQFYSDVVYGRGANANHELFKDEKPVKKLLFIWLRIHKLMRQQNVKTGAAIQVALVDPFLAFTNLAGHYPETIIKVLDDLVCGLLSKNPNGHQQLNQPSLEKLLAISSLSNFLPPAGPFPEFLMRSMSNYLLQVPSSNLDICLRSVQNAINHRNDATEGLSLILKDACNWNLYRSEMSKTLQQLRESYKETQIDLRFVRRHLWNLGPDVDLRFPRNLKAVSDKIIQTFESQYPTRRVSIHSMAGHMIIRSNIWTYNENDIRVSLSTGQGCVLASFGEKEISLAELARMVLVNSNADLGISALVAILKSMLNEYPILKKKPGNTDFFDTDTFSLNFQFQPKSALIELPVPENLGRSDVSHSKPALNRISAIDLEQIVRAAVMRLLKHEREMEMSRVRDMVVERLSALYDLTQVNFGEVVRKLEADEYVNVDKSIVRYIV